MENMKNMSKAEVEEKVDEILKKPLFIIELNYKSGNSITGAFTKFEFKDGTWTWEIPTDTVIERVRWWVRNIGYTKNYIYENVLKFGVDDIESVIQIDSFIRMSQIVDREEFVADIMRQNELLQD